MRIIRVAIADGDHAKKCLFCRAIMSRRYGSGERLGASQWRQNFISKSVARIISRLGKPAVAWLVLGSPRGG